MTKTRKGSEGDEAKETVAARFVAKMKAKKARFA